MASEETAGEASIGPDQTVFMKAHNRGSKTILHTDPDCSRLASCRKIFERPRSVYPDDTDICDWCAGDLEQGDSGRIGPWRDLEQMDPEEVV